MTFAVFVIETVSEDDRFFKSWLRNANFVAGHGINDGRGSILPAAPSIEEVCNDPVWVKRLELRLQGDHLA